ncbi:hypothetical protein FOXYSP1_07290 [Fusarium oxysporum f. sp. phaseoli]
MSLWGTEWNGTAGTAPWGSPRSAPYFSGREPSPSTWTGNGAPGVRVDAGRRREAGAPIESVLLNDAVPGDSFLGSLEVLNVQEKPKQSQKYTKMVPVHLSSVNNPIQPPTNQKQQMMRRLSLLIMNPIHHEVWVGGCRDMQCHAGAAASRSKLNMKLTIIQRIASCSGLCLTSCCGFICLEDRA